MRHLAREPIKEVLASGENIEGKCHIPFDYRSLAMFEITGDHISKLNDADLRLLIGRLCEAELRQYGLPLSSVTAGGHQDAPDGGIDVRVNAPIGPASL